MFKYLALYLLIYTLISITDLVTGVSLNLERNITESGIFTLIWLGVDIKDEIKRLRGKK